MNDHRTSPRKPGRVTRLCDKRSDVSAWSRRGPIVLLSLAGLAIATTLTLFQLDVIDSVWEPFFGDGSRHVLTSELSRALPLPDAGLGAVAYGLEAVLESIGGPRRAIDTPWVAVAGGRVAAGLCVTALALVVVQAVIVTAFCTLCLTSAATSLLIAALAAPESRVAVREIRTRHHDG